MNILQNALICAIKESMGFDLTQDSEPPKSAFSSKITLENKHFIISMNKPLLVRFATDFLDSPNPSNDTLIDIAKELANLILGKAKVLFEDSGKILKLGIPEFIGWEYISNYENAFSYKFDDMKICIYEMK